MGGRFNVPFMIICLKSLRSNIPPSDAEPQLPKLQQMNLYRLSQRARRTVLKECLQLKKRLPLLPGLFIVTCLPSKAPNNKMLKKFIDYINNHTNNVRCLPFLPKSVADSEPFLCGRRKLQINRPKNFIQSITTLVHYIRDSTPSHTERKCQISKACASGEKPYRQRQASLWADAIVSCVFFISLL